MTPTAYIVMSIEQIPDKSEVVIFLKDGNPLKAVYGVPVDNTINEIWINKGYTHYLKPVDLSKMLEETFKRGWYDRGYERKTLKVYMDEHINSVLNPPKMTEEQLTKDWQEYSGYYCKAMQDIKLKNGDEIMMCWPNAGVWNVCSDGPYKNQEIKNSDVTHVRKTHDKNW